MGIFKRFYEYISFQLFLIKIKYFSSDFVPEYKYLKKLNNSSNLGLLDAREYIKIRSLKVEDIKIDFFEKYDISYEDSCKINKLINRVNIYEISIDEYIEKRKTLIGDKINKNKDFITEKYKKQISLFIKKMDEIPSWYKLIQERGNGHAVVAESIGVKVDDYEYWANAHKEEYMLKFIEGNLDIDDIQLKIRNFKIIVNELENIIKVAKQIGINITKEMFHDYCAARASLLAAEITLENIDKS